MKVHYCWVICGVCMMTIFICIGLITNAFSMYVPFIKEQGISDSQISLIVNIRGGISLVVLFLVNRFYSKVSARLGIFLACFLAAISYMLFGMAGHNFYIYFLGSAIGGISYGLGSMIIVSEVIRRWFSTNFNLAVGIAAIGSGIATVVMPLIINGMVKTVGLNFAFIIEATAIAVMALVIFALMRNHPSEKGLDPYGCLGIDDKETVEVSYEKADLPVKTWITMGTISFIMGCIGGPGLVFLSMLFTGSGFSTELAALSISVIGLMMIFGKIILGRATDRYGTFKSFMVIGIILMVAMFMTTLLHTSVVISICVVIMIGFGFAMMMLAPASLSKDIAKPGQYFSTVRVLETLYVLGSFLYALVPGFLASVTGTYVTSYVIFGFMMLLALVLLAHFYITHRGRSYSE